MKIIIIYINILCCSKHVGYAFLTKQLLAIDFHSLFSILEVSGDQ